MLRMGLPSWCQWAARVVPSWSAEGNCAALVCRAAAGVEGWTACSGVETSGVLLSGEFVSWMLSGLLSEEFNGWYLPARASVPERGATRRVSFLHLKEKT